MLWSGYSRMEPASSRATEESSGQLINLFVLPAGSTKGTVPSSQAGLSIRNSPHPSLTWDFHLLGFWRSGLGVGYWLSSRQGLKGCQSLPAPCLHSLTEDSEHQEETVEKSNCFTRYAVPATPTSITNTKFYVTFCYDWLLSLRLKSGVTRVYNS